MSSKMKQKFNILSPEISSFNIDDQNKINILENFNINNLNNHYSKDDQSFKNKVDKLNFKFYLETDKFLNFKQEIEKSQDNLFLLLFKQISLYVEEIERLNNKLKEKEDSDKIIKNKQEVKSSKLAYYKRIC